MAFLENLDERKGSLSTGWDGGESRTFQRLAISIRPVEVAPLPREGDSAGQGRKGETGYGITLLFAC